MVKVINYNIRNYTTKRKSTLQNNKISEKQIERLILDYLNNLKDCYAWKNNTTGIYDPKTKKFRKNNGKYNINGVSDIIGVYKGRPLFIEVKTPDRKKNITEDQKLFLNNVSKFGSLSFVATSVNDVRQYLENKEGWNSWIDYLYKLFKEEFTNLIKSLM